MEGYTNLPLIMTKGGLAEKIVSNGGSLCKNVHSLTTFNDNSFELSDSGDSYIKVYNPTAKQCSVVKS